MHYVIHQMTRIALVLSVCLWGCSSENCAPVDNCPEDVTMQFQPEIRATQNVAMTVNADGVSYTANYSPAQRTGTTLDLGIEPEYDGGGFVVKFAALGVTPASIAYQVTADGITVALGTAVPRYQELPGGSCGSMCKTTQFVIPITQ